VRPLHGGGLQPILPAPSILSRPQMEKSLAAFKR
jgi:hypothetical protein